MVHIHIVPNKKEEGEGGKITTAKNSSMTNPLAPLYSNILVLAHPCTILTSLIPSLKPFHGTYRAVLLCQLATVRILFALLFEAFVSFVVCDKAISSLIDGGKSWIVGSSLNLQ